jgi:integrase
MPTLKFTKPNIDKIPLPKTGQVDYFDTETPGLGLRVGKRVKTFFVKADVKDAKKKSGYRTVRKSLGRYGEITLEYAKKLMNGHDDKTVGFVPGERLQLKRGAAGGTDLKITLDKMINTYLEEKRTRDGKPLKPSTVVSYGKILKYHFQEWLEVPIVTLCKSLFPDVVIERYKLAEKDHGAYGARNAFVMLSAVINYARIKYPAGILANPLQVLTLGNHIRKIGARSDRLDGKDFQVFYQGIAVADEIYRDCLLFCLYQGLRSEEAAAVKWDYVSIEDKILTIPDTKNRQTLCVPLCRQAVAILKRREAGNPENVAYVFPALAANGTADSNNRKYVRLLAGDLRDMTGLVLTIHGLRRTYITTGRRLKRFEDTERLTNHIDGSVTGKHYDGTGVEDLRETGQMIANEIERLMVQGVGAKVIQHPAAGNAA